jgi:hypothetical protein
MRIGTFAKRTTSVALLLLVGIAATATGCGAPSMTPLTKIAQGESYACGNPKYDSFFEEVLDARTKTSALDGEGPLKKRLADALGLEASAANDQLFGAAKEKADALKNAGGSLYVQISPEPKTFSHDGKDKSSGFAKAVEETTKAGVDKADEYSGLASQIQQTAAKLDDLKREAETAFPDAHKRAEVMQELDASGEELDKAKMRALAESGRSLSFVVALARAANTGGADVLAGEPGAAKGKPSGGKTASAAKPSGAGPAKPSGAGAAKPSGAGPTKPAGTKKPKEDFDP